MPQNNNYTDPDLREKVKEEIQKSDKGGKPGQWSARKAQLTASEYKARGGDYTTPKSKQQPSQKNLNKWTEEEWQTKEGSGTAKQADGSRKRYLPRKAWDELNEDEKQATEDKKLKASKKGHQFVGNTPRAKESRRKIAGKKQGAEKKTRTRKGKGQKKQEEENREESEEDSNDDNGSSDDRDDNMTDKDSEQEDDGQDSRQASQAKEDETAGTDTEEQPKKKRQKKA